MSIFISVAGKWKSSEDVQKIIDPMNGEQFINCPLTQVFIFFSKKIINAFFETLERNRKEGIYSKPFKMHKIWIT